MRFDLDRVVDGEFPGLTPIVCANLPYNITTPVLTRLLECRRFASVTVMIQKEVAQRICAQPGTADYGAFSVLCQYYSKPEYLFDVPASCFLPAPKVTSAVIRMTAQQPPAQIEDEAFFFRVVRAAFAQRRKTLLNSLSAALNTGLSKEALAAALDACGLPQNVRGEKLGIPDFAALTKALRSAQ